MTRENVKQLREEQVAENTNDQKNPTLDNTSEDQNTDDEAINKPARSIYLLPNLLTTGALFSGFYAVLASLHQDFTAAAIAIFAAMFFDGMDGRVARLTNTQSEFGVEFDSLSDMVSFGVAPAVLVYVWMLESLGKFGWSAAFVYTACAALRLARFNVKSAEDDKKFFMGLASPPAAAILASSAWLGHDLNSGTFTSSAVGIVTIVVGLLMVSNFKYHSFKEIHFAHKVPFTVVFAVVMFAAIVMIDPPVVLWIMAVTYALYSPVLFLFGKLRLH